MKKIRLSRELVFLLAMVTMPFAVALCTKANLGLSMIAAPTYIISEKLPITYGQTEYIFQALVLVIMCILVGKFKLVYLTSFASAVIYGSILDFYIWLLRDIEVTALWARLIVFAVGVVATAIGVALFINTYLPPCAYDYLVREVVDERKLDLKKIKLANDVTYFVLSVVLTLTLFRRFVGITWGTLVIVAVNGHLISFFSNQIQKRFDLFDRLPKLADKF